MLTGKLVRLRPIEMTDLDRYWGWINDSEAMRHVAVRALYSRTEEEEILRKLVTQTQPPEVTLAIEVASEGRHIGSVALHEIRGIERRATLGIMIGDKASWDHGYGTDTVQTMLRYGFEELNLNRIDLTVDEDNARGIACYRKCGFIEEGRLRQHRFAQGRYWDTIVMAVLAEEFFAARGRSVA
jgi:RimJ/RimL family protein N-acetyltransferase